LKGEKINRVVGAEMPNHRFRHDARLRSQIATLVSSDLSVASAPVLAKLAPSSVKAQLWA
jgi:hypothetical protein